MATISDTDLTRMIYWMPKKFNMHPQELVYRHMEMNQTILENWLEMAHTYSPPSINVTPISVNPL